MDTLSTLLRLLLSETDLTVRDLLTQAVEHLQRKQQAARLTIGLTDEEKLLVRTGSMAAAIREIRYRTVYDKYLDELTTPT